MNTWTSSHFHLRRCHGDLHSTAILKLTFIYLNDRRSPSFTWRLNKCFVTNDIKKIKRCTLHQYLMRFAKAAIFRKILLISLFLSLQLCTSLIFGKLFISTQEVKLTKKGVLYLSVALFSQITTKIAQLKTYSNKKNIKIFFSENVRKEILGKIVEVFWTWNKKP